MLRPRTVLTSQPLKKPYRMPKKNLPKNSPRRHLLTFKFGKIEQFSELKGVDLKNLDPNNSVVELELVIPIPEYLLA
jgi:hypothetical protein